MKYGFMKLLITYNELQTLIHKKTGKAVRFQKAEDGNTVQVTYTVEVDVPLIGKISKDVAGIIKFNGITDTVLDVTYSLSMGLELVAKGIKTFLGEQIERTQLMKWGEKENQMLLFVDKIAEKLHVDNVDKLTKFIRITEVWAAESGLEIEAEIRYDAMG